MKSSIASSDMDLNHDIGRGITQGGAGPATSHSMDDLASRLATLEKRFKLHTHIGSDMSQKLPLKVFSGAVNSDGTTDYLPPGWTSVKTATGKYTITHNLGTTSYSAVGISLGGIIIENARNANDVQLENITTSAVAADNHVTFILVRT